MAEKEQVEKADKKEKKGKKGKTVKKKLVRKRVERRTTDKWKKKKWFTIVAPKEFSNKVVGETPAEKVKVLDGRVIKTNLGNLSNQRQKRHISVSFKINKVEGTTANTILTGHEISSSYLGRMTRRRSSKVETVQTVMTKDKQSVKVKTIAITARKAKVNQRTAMRQIMIAGIADAAKKKTCNQFVQELIFGTISTKIFADIKKIVPVKRVEIAKSKIYFDE
ncbi:MAG: 30S ribosomal protein S3ae [Candidatus Diapherotrites archaeon]